MMYPSVLLRKMGRAYADAFLVSLALKLRNMGYLDNVKNSVFRFIGLRSLGDERSVSVDKRDVRELLSFSFVPIILYYWWSSSHDKLRGLISVYRREIFGDLVLAVAYTGSQELFDLFLDAYSFLTRASTISYVLALDEILLRFSIDDALPFVIDIYQSLDVEPEEYQLRQAASSSIALAIRIIHGKTEPCRVIFERLSIDSRELRFFRLYPMLAKNIYGCGYRERALSMFSSLVDLVRLSVDTTGEFRFVVPPSPKALAYVLRENAKMVAEFFIKIEDLARSEGFVDNVALSNIVMKLYKLNGDPRALLLAEKLGFLGNKDFEELVSTIREAVKHVAVDGFDALLLDIGKVLALRSIGEDTLDFTLRSLLGLLGNVPLDGLGKGFFLEALKTYRLYSSA